MRVIFRWAVSLTHHFFCPLGSLAQTSKDMGFPSTVYLVLQKIDKRTSTRMRAEKYTCHPVRWVGGGQINNAIEDDEEDDEEE